MDGFFRARRHRRGLGALVNTLSVPKTPSRLARGRYASFGPQANGTGHLTGGESAVKVLMVLVRWSREELPTGVRPPWR